MKMLDIIQRLQAILPRYTDYFTDVLSVSSLTRSSTTVTAITTTNHGLTTNNYINITGAYEANPIDSLTQINNIATAITQNPNDITITDRFFNETVKISGADQADYNGDKTIVIAPEEFDIVTITRVGQVATVATKQKHGFVVNANFNIEIFGSSVNGYNDQYTIASIVDDNTFTMNVLGTPLNSTTGHVKALLSRYVIMFEVENDPVSPATGTPILNEDKLFNYNGRHQITVVNNTTFTYEITGTPISPAIGTIVAEKYLRITGIITINRGNEIYTPQTTGDYWAFVVMGDLIANKDRLTTIDAIYRKEVGKDYDQDLIQNFSIYVYAPTNNEIAARAARDSMVDIRIALFKSLLDVVIDSGLNNESDDSIVFVNDGTFAYSNAYYIHEFNFQAIYKILQDNVAIKSDNISLRNFEVDYIRKNEVTYEDESIKDDVGTFD